MKEHIEEALVTLRNNRQRYARAERYYSGEHDLAFATEKFQNTFGELFREFALNLCPAVCDSVRDKLRIRGFGLEGLGHERAAVAAGERQAIHSHTREIWARGRMSRIAGEIHKEALKCGDAYAVVWPDSQGHAAITPNRAADMAVFYDDEQPGLITRAAKLWTLADKRQRLNLFYPDRIEKYVSRAADMSALPSLTEFAAYTAPGSSEGHLVPNPYGIVPVFHFANNADLGQFGRSELEPAMPVQDGLNKSVLDMLVAMEYAAYRQRWAAGIEMTIDADGNPAAPFKAGVDHVWIAENPSARFGDFDGARLDQFLRVKDGFRLDIASVTGTPVHYLLQNTGNFPSGESLKKTETRFLAKVRDRQEGFGQVWADAMAFALVIEGRHSGIRLLTEWEDPAPMGEREFLENILLKKQLGIPVEQALIEAGYGEADIRGMAANEKGETREKKEEKYERPRDK